VGDRTADSASSAAAGECCDGFSMMDSTGLSGDDRTKFEQAFLTHQERERICGTKPPKQIWVASISQLQLHGKTCLLDIEQSRRNSLTEDGRRDANDLSTLADEAFTTATPG